LVDVAKPVYVVPELIVPLATIEMTLPLPWEIDVAWL